MKKILVFALMLASLSAFAGEKTLINLDSNGLAIQGYDPVAFFTEHRPVKGNPQFSSSYNGAKYNFASAANKSAFDASPAKYEPQFGGYCAYAASKGHTAPVKVEASQVLNGRLLMQYDLEVRDKFNEDPQNNLKLADKNWPGLVDKYGK
jgi:YHS domain-containing protein